MTAETAQTTEAKAGGFVGDPAEAFAPPAAGGCCGSAPTATSETGTAGGCCGSTAVTATESTGCCG